MKKTILIFGIILLVITASPIHGLGPADVEYPTIQVKVHNACNDEVCGHGYNINGTSYVPIRLVAESMGAEVGWDDATKTVFIKKEEPEKKAEDNPDEEVYRKDTARLFIAIEKEMEFLRSYERQIAIAYEIYTTTNDSSWVTALSSGKRKERETGNDELTKLIDEYYQAYKDTNPSMIEISNLKSQINESYQQYNLSIDFLNNYIKNGKNEDLKNHLLYRKFAQDTYEKIIEQFAELKIALDIR